MSSITLTIPDALTAGVVAGFCGLHGYVDEVYEPVTGTMIPNPETRAAFMKRAIMQKIKRDVLEWEGNEGQRVAKAAGESEIQLL